VATITVGKGP